MVAMDGHGSDQARVIRIVRALRLFRGWVDGVIIKPLGKFL